MVAMTRPAPVACGTGVGLLRWLSAASMTVLTSLALADEQAGVRGYWQEPSGAVIRVADCSAGLCLRIVALPPGNHPRTDLYNPDQKFRGRALCGLLIGQGFKETDPQHAQGGQIYDPKSGRTYSGSMMAQGDTLRLRGYLLFSLLGRTESWTRVAAGRSTCATA